MSDNKIILKIKKNPITKKIINNLELTDEEIEKFSFNLLDIIEENKKKYEGNWITKLVRDDFGIVQVKQKQTNTNLAYNYLFSEISSANFKVIFPSGLPKKNNHFISYDQTKLPAAKTEKNKSFSISQQLKRMINVKRIIDDEKEKGLYISGAFGVGKTYFLNALANTLSFNGEQIAFFTLNEISTFLKANFQNGYDEIINKIKLVDFLFLDDIGAETASNWLIGDVLFNIINYRINNQLTTFFSSNFSLNALEENWIKQGVNNFKVKRVIDRIKGLSREIIFYGENQRLF